MMIRVLCVIPLPENATSYYRAIGPLSRLKYLHDGIELIFSGKPTWPQMYMADLCFIQRPHDGDSMNALELAKQCGVPIWLDYDDNVLEVPDENMYYDVFSAPTIKMNVMYALGLATVITVSTQYLKDRWKQFSKNIVVINNAWDDYRFPIKDIQYEPRAKRILWRGGASHVRDLDEISGQILSVSKENPKWEWVFSGYRPYNLLRELGDRAKYIPMMNLLTYFEKLRDFNCALQIVPLVDTPFNRSKSNCAWLEGTYSGAVSAPMDWDEWPVGFNINQLSNMLKLKESKYEELWNISKERIQDTYLLSQINKQRVDLIKEYSK